MTSPEEAPVRALVADTSRVLASGRYGRFDVAPMVSFEIPEADRGRWLAVQGAEGFFDIEQDVGSPDVIAVQFAWPTAVHGAGAEPMSLARAPDALPALQANPGLIVVETSSAAIAGLSGSGLTLDHGGTGSDFRPVLDVAAGPISIGPGRRLWIGFFDVAGVVLAILIGGSVERWADAVTAAQPILASVTLDSEPGVP